MSQNFSGLWAQAMAAGETSCAAVVPRPMVLVEADCLTGVPKPGGQRFFESEGACGFAWIEFAGNKPFGRWAKAAGVARKHYPSGLAHSVRQGGQSVARKEAFAYAAAAVLKAGCVECHVGSRLD